MHDYVAEYEDIASEDDLAAFAYRTAVKANELEAIVAKLPKDAENNPCFHGDNRWGTCHSFKGPIVRTGRVFWDGDGGWCIGFGVLGLPIPVEEGFATQEAAEAAAKD